MVDTRYDIDDALSGKSRRLVDVCDELQLGVTQPELLGISMTALHRRWIVSQAVTARERITILNLRHSLSTALVALTTTYGASWSGQLNVNRLLMTELVGQYSVAVNAGVPVVVGGMRCLSTVVPWWRLRGRRRAERPRLPVHSSRTSAKVASTLGM